jgi:hypothetical protein
MRSGENNGVAVSGVPISPGDGLWSRSRCERGTKRFGDAGEGAAAGDPQ